MPWCSRKPSGSPGRGPRRPSTGLRISEMCSAHSQERGCAYQETHARASTHTHGTVWARTKVSNSLRLDAATLLVRLAHWTANAGDAKAFAQKVHDPTDNTRQRVNAPTHTNRRLMPCKLCILSYATLLPRAARRRNILTLGGRDNSSSPSTEIPAMLRCTYVVSMSAGFCIWGVTADMLLCRGRRRRTG